MTRATVGGTVKVLEKKGLITKVSEPRDTRSYVMCLSEKRDSPADRAVQ